MPQEQGRQFLAARQMRSKGKPVIFIVVPKGIVRRAVDRNAIKRKIRSVLAPLLKQFKLSYRISVRDKRILSVPFRTLEEEIKKQLNIHE